MIGLLKKYKDSATTFGVEFRNITKRYGTDPSAPFAVKGVSFGIEKGTLTTILGPSGCGKTTVLRMIASLESPTGGQIFMDGKGCYDARTG